MSRGSDANKAVIEALFATTNTAYMSQTLADQLSRTGHPA